MHASIKAVKEFQPKEPMKGHMVNMLKGLKLNEEIFAGPELIKLSGFVKHSFTSSKKKYFSWGYLFFKQLIRIQLDVIDHPVQRRILPESRRPNSCIISFLMSIGGILTPLFQASSHRQTTLASRHMISSDSTGNHKGTLTLPLKEGSNKHHFDFDLCIFFHSSNNGGK